MTKKDNIYWEKLMATWVLSCKDKQPIMFYESLSDRLEVNNIAALRRMVTEHRELFRPMVESTFKKYVAYYKEKDGRFPETLKRENEKNEDAIDRQEPCDTFTSQFRRLPKDPRSSDELTEWGVKYIERKWKMEVKRKEQIWHLWRYAIIPIVSVIIGALVGKIL